MRKPWQFLTEQEITNLKKQQCDKCKYFSKNRKSTTFYATATCNYILEEKHSRKCDPRDCIKKGRFEPRKRGRRKKT